MNEKFKLIKIRIFFWSGVLVVSIFLPSFVVEYKGWFIFCIIFSLVMILSSLSEFLKKRYLWNKYHDQDVVEKIYKKQFWQGQTNEQLKDSIGPPSDVDRKVLKTKTKETWKYNEHQKGRYKYKFFLENDEVIGWEIRS